MHSLQLQDTSRKLTNPGYTLFQRGKTTWSLTFWFFSSLNSSIQQIANSLNKFSSVIIVLTLFFQALAFLNYSRYSLGCREHQLSLPQLNTVLYKNMFVNYANWQRGKKSSTAPLLLRCNPSPRIVWIYDNVILCAGNRRCRHWRRQGGPRGPAPPPPIAGQKRFFLLK